MFIEVLVLMLTTLIVYYIYIYKAIHNYFDRRGLRYSSGIPVFGNVFNGTFLRRHTIEDIEAVYKAFPGERYVGFAEGVKPIILVRDPELIKLIAVKEYEHFMMRKPFLPDEIAPGLANSVAMLQVRSWRESRQKLGSMFTGSKIKQLLPLLSEVRNNLMNYLEDHQSEDLEVMDLLLRYANDVNVSTLLGIQVNSYKDRENIFMRFNQENNNYTYKKIIISYLATQFKTAAKLMKFLNIVVLPSDVSDFFRETVAKTIKDRENNNITRPDYINTLTKNSKDWTSDAIAGVAYMASLAGFEPTASTITMCIHELALNPEIQEKLYQEISISREKIGEVTCDDVSNLKYLDCVLNETFRKWSNAMIYRTCTKSYVLPPPREDGKPYQVNPGDMLYCVANPLHKDPQYHPDPEVFDPDRFSDDNKHNIKPFTFMPFGTGPKNCVGLRFSTFNMKFILYHIVLKFKIVKCARTATPIRLLPSVLNVRSIGGTWVHFEARN